MRSARIYIKILETYGQFLINRMKPKTITTLTVVSSLLMMIFSASSIFLGEKVFTNIYFAIATGLIGQISISMIIVQDAQKFGIKRKNLLLERISIAKAPGSKLLSFVDFFYSPKTVELTFKPLITDWRYEYFEALKQGRKWKARWVSMRYRCAFVWSMTLSKVFLLLKQIKSVSK